jgi:hypothetical protein
VLEAKLFEIEGHWIARVKGRSSLYRFWYDQRAGEIRRRSLETADVEVAKRLVAEHALNTASLLAQEPRDALLSAVLNHYFTSHSDNLRSLNTWARPQAILDLNTTTQVDFEAQLLYINQPGRKQNNKKRPKIQLTENLTGWLQCWAEARPLTYAKTIIQDGQKVIVCEPATNIKAQFKRRTIR